MNDTPLPLNTIIEDALTTEEKLKILAQAILTLNSELVWLANSLTEVDEVGLTNAAQIWEIANDTSV